MKNEKMVSNRISGPIRIISLNVNDVIEYSDAMDAGFFEPQARTYIALQSDVVVFGEDSGNNLITIKSIQSGYNIVSSIALKIKETWRTRNSAQWYWFKFGFTHMFGYTAYEYKVAYEYYLENILCLDQWEIAYFTHDYEHTGATFTENIKSMLGFGR